MKIFFPVFVFILNLSGCSKAPDVVTLSGNAQGTTYHFTYWVDPATASEKINPETLQQRANGILAQIDMDISNYREDSAIEIFNRTDSTQSQNISAEIVKLITIAREINQASAGCYDLTIKPLFDLWGFKADKFHEPSAEELSSNLALVGMDKIVVEDATHVHKNLGKLRVDMSSIGQGYAIGKIAELLESLGIKNYLVEIGGEMQVAGVKPAGVPWRIAIEKPVPTSSPTAAKTWQKIMELHGEKPIAVMTSGTYRHFFDQQGKRYSHILDARTAKPVAHNTVSTTVWHTSASYADAWSTAFLCLGREAGLQVANQHKVPVLFIEQNESGLVETASEALRGLGGVEFIKH